VKVGLGLFRRSVRRISEIDRRGRLAGNDVVSDPGLEPRHGNDLLELEAPGHGSSWRQLQKWADARDDMLDRVPAGQHSMLDYRAIAENGSMLNTPNTWGIYIISLVCEWLTRQGGLTAIAAKNAEKAGILYDAIDNSDGFFTGHAERSAKSLMNVTFRLPSAELEAKFCTEATAQGLDGLKGHRSVGGIRASIYNAFPREGVERLVELMGDFAGRS